MRLILLVLSRAQVVVAILGLVIVTSPPSAVRYGDRLQVALPLLAWACAGSRSEGTEFFLRYTVMLVTAHASKAALGEAAINSRPDGGTKGFPSAHTSTAVLGASALVHECLRAVPLAQAAVIVSAAFVGASRIEGHKHDIWQVFAGALLGYGCDRMLRRRSPARAWVARILGRTGATLAARAGRTCNALRQVVGATVRQVSRRA